MDRFYLSEPCKNTTMKFISAQIQIGSVYACKTGNVVFSLLNRQLFSAYCGKYSRYAMEQNVGPTTAGDQKLGWGWLYSQTNSLRQLWAKLTYSGDSPFLLRLVIGVSNEQSSDAVSWLPLYVSNNTTDFHPLTCEAETGKRTELNVPFRKELPRTSFVSIEDIVCVCPHATHMITRCVEIDHCKMAQKIRWYASTRKKIPFRALRKYWPDRNQKDIFSFPTVSIGKVGAVSLSRICARLSSLTRKKWKSLAHYLKISGKVLQAIYPCLVSKDPGKTLGCITTKDASELLRESSNECTKLVGAGGEFNASEYKKWAEIYYQVSALIFGEQGLTAYNLKLLLML